MSEILPIVVPREPVNNKVHDTLPSSIVPSDLEDGALKKGRVFVIITVLTGTTFLSSLSNGFLTIGLPRIASELSLSDNLILWPSSAYFLTCSACLLLAGSISDVIGARIVNLVGCLVTSIFILACGFARTGIHLIMFRAMQGIAVSLCLPTSVAIVAQSIPAGLARNIGFSCLGFVQPIGFSVGMVLEGVIVETIGWRFSFYFSGGLSLALFGISIWALPRDVAIEGFPLAKLKKEIDWVGALMASTCLALFSYVLATLTGSVSNIRKPVHIALLVISAALVPVFIMWQSRRERLNLPALIPNSFWKNPVFTSVCLIVLFSNAVINGMEVFCSLFFQKVQNISAIGASVRILPSLIVGFIVQLSTGLLIHRSNPYILVVATLTLSAGGPLLMAFINESWPYWYAAFPAQILAPLACDILFTIGLLAISEGFPEHMQGLAGAVFNTVAQFGASFGLALTSVVAAAGREQEGKHGKGPEEGLKAGYRLAFWTMFALTGLACAIGGYGLRRMGKLGLKKD